ncbi:methyltransferase domain-containing protein [Actinomadura parmotrematis]|uniref:Methyltransferase domain-containing protein n=1 Tax=Actinomadura parmotrematis TaxID=2864039 RepID=A0ABS7G559_9ACTN|nr:methyltransferase domain-containing protein [Actinomadura parmotrematis]MBW8487666.1 methyltransferase domain-containing protein [Actinomadura parmotrematis]
MAAEPAYTWDNANPHATDQLRHLTAVLDPPTVAGLSGLGDLAGRRCLDVGAGNGTIARWLADRVGPEGRVTAVDLKPLDIPPHPRLRVVTQDVTAGDLPGGPYDLVHARLVLMHLPERLEVLGRMAGALAPGGTVVLHEWDCTHPLRVLTAPDQAAADLVTRANEALCALMTSRGARLSWSYEAHAAMEDAGLTGVTTAFGARSWRGGSEFCLLHLSNTHHLTEQLTGAGLTAEDLVALREVLMDPRLVLAGYPLYRISGRRPD